MKTVQLLDAVRAKHKLPSDYAAAGLLGLTRAQISRYRNGKDFFGDEVALRVAALLEADPAVIVADMHAERARDEQGRALWLGISERLRAAGVAAVVLLSLGFWTGGPDGGAYASAASQQATAPGLYIMSTARRALSTARRWLQSLFGGLLAPANGAEVAPC